MVFMHEILQKLIYSDMYTEIDDYYIPKVIAKIKSELGGVGGGHKLAGGIRLSKPSYNLLKEKADELI